MKRLHYGWIIVIVSAIVFTFSSMRWYTFGVFLLPLTERFGWSRGALAWAPSVSSIIQGPMSILIGKLSDKYGPRIFATISAILTVIGFLLMSQVTALWQVYLVWGVTMGCASACAYVPIMSTIPRWFTTNRTTAIGITITGFGVAALIWPPIAQLLITAVGWQNAFLILAGITAVVVIPLTQLLKSHPQKMNLLPVGEEITSKSSSSSPQGLGLSLKQALKTPGFWIFGPILFCFYSSLNVMFVHIVAHARDLGITPIVAASALSIIGGTSIIGRLSIGSLFERIGIRRALITSVALGVIGIGILVVFPEDWAFYLFLAIFGLSYGSFVSMETAVPAELFGVKSLGSIMAALGLLPTIGVALAPPLAGAIFDATGKYEPAFIMCLILVSIALILSFILLHLKDTPKLNNIS